MAIEIKNPQAFGDSIRRRRESLGLTQEELAKKVGTTLKTIYRVESGKQKSRLENTLQGLAAGLDLPFAMFLEAARNDLEIAPPLPPDEHVESNGRGSVDGENGPEPRDKRPVTGVLPQRWNGLHAAVLLILIVIIGLLLLGLGDEEPTRVDVQGSDLVWIGTETGKVKHRLSFESAITIVKECPWAGVDYLAVGLRSTGIDGGLFAIVDTRAREIVFKDVPQMAEMIDFYQDQRLGQGLCTVYDIEFCQFDGVGEEELVVVRRHDTWYPSYIRIFNHDFDVIGTYHHPGHINVMYISDLDQDGRDELYVGGTHNGYAGASVFVLDFEHCSGFAQDGNGYFRSDLADSSLARVVFPGFEQRYLDLLNESRLEIYDLRPSIDENGKGQLLLRINKVGNLSLTVYTNRFLEPIEVTATDAFKHQARLWVSEGLLDRDISDQGFLDDWLAGHLHFSEGRQTHPALVPSP